MERAEKQAKWRTLENAYVMTNSGLKADVDNDDDNDPKS